MKDAYNPGQESDTIDVSELLNDDGSVNVGAVKARQAGGVTPSVCAELRQRIHDEQIRLADLAEDYEAAASTIKDHVNGNCSCPVDTLPVKCTMHGKSWVKVNRCGETRENGDACKRVTGGDACWQHDDVERCGAYTNGLKPCTEPATEGERCWRHADRDSVPCPHDDCERVFDSEHAVKSHHYQAHGESLIPEAECDYCGETFQPRAKNEGVYCSQECMAADYVSQATVTCEHCEDEFEVQEHMADERRFCSRECMLASRDRTEINCECATCGDTFRRPPSKVREVNYCTPTCASAARRRRVTLTCAECGDDFAVKPSEADNRTFCSRSCTLTAQSTPDETKTCACGRTFKLGYDETDHCSQHCASEVSCDRPRPDDHTTLVWLLYHYEGLSEAATIRRANVNTDEMLSPADVVALIDETEHMTLMDMPGHDTGGSSGVAGDD